MWPFFRKAEEKRSPFESSSRKPVQFPDITEDMRKLLELGIHNTAFKFWLPEAVFEALVDISERNGESVSQSLRQFFALHCYGLYAYICIQEKHPEIFRDADSGIRYSIAEPAAAYTAEERMDRPPPVSKRPKVRDPVYWVPDLGKNVWPVKVWIPECVRKDLQLLADHVGIPVSQYVREITISRILGHGTLPKRPNMMEVVPLPGAQAWERDEDVPYRVAANITESLSHERHGTATRTWTEEEDDKMRAKAASKGGEAI